MRTRESCLTMALKLSQVISCLEAWQDKGIGVVDWFLRPTVPKTRPQVDAGFPDNVPGRAGKTWEAYYRSLYRYYRESKKVLESITGENEEFLQCMEMCRRKPKECFQILKNSFEKGEVRADDDHKECSAGS